MKVDGEASTERNLQFETNSLFIATQRIWTRSSVRCILCCGKVDDELRLWFLFHSSLVFTVVMVSETEKKNETTRIFFGISEATIEWEATVPVLFKYVPSVYVHASKGTRENYREGPDRTYCDV